MHIRICMDLIRSDSMVNVKQRQEDNFSFHGAAITHNVFSGVQIIAHLIMWPPWNSDRIGSMLNTLYIYTLKVQTRTLRKEQRMLLPQPRLERNPFCQSHQASDIRVGKRDNTATRQAHWKRLQTTFTFSNCVGDESKQH